MKRFLSIFLLFSTVVFAQSWQVVGRMPYPVYGGQAVVIDSMIYILGGFSEKEYTSVNYIQQYNPHTGDWTIIDTMKVARRNFVAGNYNNNVVYFGGTNYNSPYASSLEEWSGTSRSNIIDSNQFLNRQYSTGTILGDTIFTFGGSSQTVGSQSPYMFEYNIKSSSVVFSSDTLFTGSIPALQMSAAVGNNIYIIGGATTLGLLPTIIRYNILYKEFSILSDTLLKPRAEGAAVTCGNEIYVIGGRSETHSAVNSVDVININGDGSINNLQSGPALNNARSEPMAVYYNGAIYVFGGKNVDNEGETQPVSAIEKLDIITGIYDSQPLIATGFKLDNNYPNPFNPSTQITFTIAKESHVSLDIYNILGEHIKNLTSKIYAPGNYRLTWDGTNNSGRQVAGGIYVYKLSSDYFTDAKKMMLLK